jgi:hypothetical protein
MVDHLDHPDERVRQVLDQDLERTTRRPDEWVTHHTQHGDLGRGDAAVSRLVRRMDPLAESAYLSRQRQRLLDDYIVPPPVLLAAIAERQAVLNETLAAAADDPNTAAGLRTNAQRDRARAAHLRDQAAAGDTGTTWESLTNGTEPPASAINNDDTAS